MTNSEMITTGEAARRVGVDESTIRRWTNTGRLRFSRTPGGDRRIDTVDLMALMQPGDVDLGEAAPPEVMVEHWAVVSAGWGGWRPAAKLTDDRLAMIRAGARHLIADLERVTDAITSELNRRDG